MDILSLGESVFLQFSHYDNFLDAVFIIDKTGSIFYGNESGARLIGVSLRRLLKIDNFFNEVTFEGGLETLFTTSTYLETNFTTRKGLKGRTLVLIESEIFKHNQEDVELWKVVLREVGLEKNLQKKYRSELAQKESTIKDLKQAKKELELYSKNLEEMVAKRTSELNYKNSFLNAMVNSIGQALFVFDAEGVCLPTYTHICEIFFGAEFKDKKVWELLSGNCVKDFDLEFWAKGLFKEMIPFIDLVNLGPKSLTTKDFRFVELEYFQMFCEDGQMVGVVVVGTDCTETVVAMKDLDVKKRQADKISKIIQGKQMFVELVDEVRFTMDDLINIFNSDKCLNLNVVSMKLIKIHSLKGGVSLFSMVQVENALNSLENVITDFLNSDSRKREEDRAKVKSVSMAVGTVLQQEVEDCTQMLGPNFLSDKNFVSISYRELDKIKDQLPESSQVEFKEKYLKRPVYSFFVNYDKFVFEHARERGFEVSPIEFIGCDMLVEVNRFDRFFSSLINLFRNIIAHGLESPQERQHFGKSVQNRIKVECRMDLQDNLVLSVEDDGRGISVEDVKRQLKWFTTEELLNLTESEVLASIFSPGVTTHVSQTLLAGRGLGLSAIKQVVEFVGGKVEVYSRVNEYCRFVFCLPVK